MRSKLLQQLAQRIDEIQANARPHVQPAIALDIPQLADALPGKCLPAGAIVELLEATEGAGAWTLALLLAGQACASRPLLVIADGQRCFYPPAAARLGIDLRRTLVIRPKTPEQALAALVQSLGCAAVGAVIGSFEHVDAAGYRRLQLAAETSGGVGILLRPATFLKVPSFAAVRLLVSPPPIRRGQEAGRQEAARRRIQIEVVRVRGGKAGKTFLLEIDHETGHVHLPAPLAAPAPLPGAPRTAG